MLLQGAKKHKILRLLGGSRQDHVFEGAKAAVFSGLVPRRRSFRQINPKRLPIPSLDRIVMAGLTSIEDSTARKLT